MRLASFGLAVALGTPESPPRLPRRIRRSSRALSRRPPAPASTASTRANGSTWSAAARLPSTAMTTAIRRCCWPAASSRRSSIAMPARRAAPLKFAAEPSGLELDKVSGAYPLDVDSDGITDLVLLRVGENVVDARPGRLPVRARQRGLGLQRRRLPGGRRLPRPGRRAPTGRRSRSAATSTARRKSRPGARAPTTGCCARRLASASSARRSR